MKEFIVTEVTDLSSLLKLNRSFTSPFIYRGQTNFDWNLCTSLERAILNFSKYAPQKWGFETEEKWMLHEFIEKYPLYGQIMPKQTDYFEWLAIMQHFGAPTRLLDFSKSLFIALFFSINEASTDSCVWAINRYQLRDNLIGSCGLEYEKGYTLKDEVNNIHIELANKHITHRATEDGIVKTVVPLEPKIATERLARQQGIFLMPLNTWYSFHDNLIGAFDVSDISFHDERFEDIIEYANKNSYNNGGIKIMKIKIPYKLHLDFLFGLKQMNITAETLFPGLGGLAQSLLNSHIRL